MTKQSVIISPFSRLTPKGQLSAKDWPFFPQLISKLKEKNIETIQIGKKDELLIGADHVFFDLSFPNLLNLLKEKQKFISIDNFFPHFANYYGYKGVVIFTKSNPNVFGYKNNCNLLKNEIYLRPKKEQFVYWDNIKAENNSFVSVDLVFDSFLSFYNLS